MALTFYIAAAVAIAATVMVVTRHNAVHALLYLVVSLLAIAVAFFVLGAPFVAAMEVIVYAGAIMVLFIFVIMMLNQGPAGVEQERAWLRPRAFIAPAIMAAILLASLARALGGEAAATSGAAIEPHAVGMALFGPYVLAVELASFLLTAGLVGAYHLGRRERPGRGR